jgi:hypothetical protein
LIWTKEHYSAVREHLSTDSREVFDEMAANGLRLLEVVGTEDATLLRARWHQAVKKAGAEPAPPEILRNDYIIAKRGGRK